MVTDNSSKLTLNNLKILRITDNFLPPLYLTKKQNIKKQSIANSISEGKKAEDSSAQTEEKLLKWLNKVRISKEEERKRLFGLKN